MERIIDSHAHLNEEGFLGHTKEILDRAKEFGIEKVLIPSWDIESSKKAIEIAEEFDNVYAAVSIHAQDVGPFVLKDLDTIKCLAKSSKKVIAIGETGLDYHYGKEDASKQKEFFIAQLDIARELNLPVIIHLRDAAGDYLDLIWPSRQYEGFTPWPNVTGPTQQLQSGCSVHNCLQQFSSQQCANLPSIITISLP